MTTKQYLNQIEKLNRLINNKLSEVYQLKQLASSISVSTDSERVKSSSLQDKIGSAVAKIVDLENEIDSIIDTYVSTRRKIISQIDSIENENYYDVLFSRYVEKKTFEEIAIKTDYSFRQVLRIHDKAVAYFEKKFGKEYMTENPS